MRKKSGKQQFSAFILSFVYFLFFSVQTVFAWDFHDLFRKDMPVAEPLQPDLKMYAKCEKIPVKIDAKTLISEGMAFEDISAVYDGNTDTVFTSDKSTEIILDLGGIYMLGGVKAVLPEYEDSASKSRCIGTEFYVSNDKKTFYKTAELTSVQTVDFEEECQELMFGGVGEYRYVKLFIPTGAKISEIEWLEYPEWSYTQSAQKGKKDMNLHLYAYDIQRELKTHIVAAVYNVNGILKSFNISEQSFYPDTQTEIDLKIPELICETGDSYRIMVWESNGNSVLANTLTYRYSGASEKFSVSNLFSDNMLLQAEKPLTIWGKAPTGSNVEITLENIRGGSVNRSVVVKEGSDWEADLGTFTEGGSYILTIQCAGEIKTFRNITFGDVWLCMGQSNMEYYMLCGNDTVKYLKSEQGCKEADNPDIRVLNLLNKGIEGAGAPLDELPLAANEDAWAVMDSSAAGYCSAIGYYFAQRINQKYDVPVGLLCVAVGDTEINRWLPQGSFGSFSATDGGLFYNRIMPLSKLQIRGILMYQGEADEYRTHQTAVQYCDAMSGLVDLYREIWGEKIPFYWAQLTRYSRDESEVREGQRLAQYRVKEIENTGVISLIDIYGEYKGGTGSCRDDIHPHQKETAAERFFRYAQRDVYGEPNTEASGPEYISMKIVGDKIELTFDCTGELSVLPQERYSDSVTAKLIKKNKIDTSKLQEFEIAGEDGEFKKADAEIQGDKVLVWSSEVPNPTAVRYAWGAYPEMPNLTDATGLPALSFSTAEAK